MKRFLATAALALAFAHPVQAATSYRELADCAGYTQTTTCFAGLTLVRVSAVNQNERVFNGKLSPVRDNMYQLTNGIRTIRVYIKPA